jgi:hypothetical protein
LALARGISGTATDTVPETIFDRNAENRFLTEFLIAALRAVLRQKATELKPQLVRIR